MVGMGLAICIGMNDAMGTKKLVEYHKARDLVKMNPMYRLGKKRNIKGITYFEVDFSKQGNGGTENESTKNSNN
jgi:hypothetical protein